MREQIEALAMQGAPSVSSLIELDGKIEFQTQRVTSEVHAERRSLAFTEVPDALALVAWMHRDALIAALDREIAVEGDDKAALSHEARQQREAEAMGDLLSVDLDGAGARSAVRIPPRHQPARDPTTEIDHRCAEQRTRIVAGARLFRPCRRASVNADRASRGGCCLLLPGMREARAPVGGWLLRHNLSQSRCRRMLRRRGGRDGPVPA
jgi:hypothetical protein